MNTEAPRLSRPALVALTVATVTNYVWQVPYAIHQYGSAWVGLPRLSGVLVVTLVWFLVGVMRYARRQRGGTALLASFLAIEALFYLLHNLTGAFGHDLPMTNPIVLIASVLGYLNLAAAVAALAAFAWMSHLGQGKTAQPDAGTDRNRRRLPRSNTGSEHLTWRYGHESQRRQHVAHRDER